MSPAVQQLGGLDLADRDKAGQAVRAWLDARPGDGEADRGRCHFVGLPGNPVSSFVTFLLLVRPLLLRLRGITGGQGVFQSGADGLPPAGPAGAFRLAARGSPARVPARAPQCRRRPGPVPEPELGRADPVAWCDGLVDLPAGQTIEARRTGQLHPLAALLAEPACRSKSVSSPRCARRSASQPELADRGWHRRCAARRADRARRRLGRGAGTWPCLRAALDQAMVGDDAALRDGAEVAFFRP